MASLAQRGGRRMSSAFQFLFKLRPVLSQCSRTRRSLHRCIPLFGVKGTELRMPSLSPTMTEGTIVRWLKKEGDPIQPGDALCEIQTDKAVVAFETEETGILAKILKTENSGTIPINALIGMMVEEGADWKDVEVPADVAASPDDKPKAPAEPPKHVDDHSHSDMLGPAVKNLLHAYGLQAKDVPATGPFGVLLKGDVMKYVQDRKISKVQESVPEVAPVSPPPAAKPTPAKPSAPTEGYVDTPLTNMRRAIAKRLSLSKSTIPHSYMTVECAIDETLSTRKKYAADGVKVSLNDFVIKSAATALKRVPDMNAAWQNERAVRLNSIDVSVAVATDSGLITPIVRNADVLGIEDISRTVRELATRARAGKLKPAEFEGGSFAVSNLGMFGISSFTAVINPPQAAIMAVGGSKLVPDTSGKTKTLLTATLSYDPRVCTEEVVAGFLAAFKEHLENPLHMLGLAAPRFGENVTL